MNTKEYKINTLICHLSYENKTASNGKQYRMIHIDAIKDQNGFEIEDYENEGYRFINETLHIADFDNQTSYVNQSINETIRIREWFDGLLIRSEFHKKAVEQEKSRIAKNA